MHYVYLANSAKADILSACEKTRPFTPTGADGFLLGIALRGVAGNPEIWNGDLVDGLSIQSFQP